MVSGVHARSEAWLLGNPPAKVSQSGSFLRVQSGTKIFFVFSRDAPDLAEDLSPFLGEMELVVAPVSRAAVPLNDSLALEVIDQSHHAARH